MANGPELIGELPAVDLRVAAMAMGKRWPVVYRRSGEEAFLAIGPQQMPSRTEVERALTEHRELRAVGWVSFSSRREWNRSEWRDFSRNAFFVPSLLVLERDGRQNAIAFGEREERENLFGLLGQLRSLSPGEVNPEEGTLLMEEVDRERFRRNVAQVAGGDGVEKVVMARRMEVCWERGFDVAGVLADLERNFPQCTSYLIAPGAGEVFFVGATPERLVTVREGYVETMALAGTAAPQTEDLCRLGRRKEQREHAFVVDYILRQLEDHTQWLDSGEEEVMKLRNVHHLKTPIAGRLKDGRGVLQVVEALHPTPAVCGVPREEVEPLIAEMEGFDRGLYAGAMGWMDADGDGEFDVLLRCALIDGSRATIFSGAGITAESDVDEETEETAQKAEAMLQALDCGRRGGKK